ncbi:MAG TPA: FAD binding domain-containing protein [Verrucomicrobiae bacterium]|nr:FAD binding domain-containing protein [Verrucomicrobiae bacterium]
MFANVREYYHASSLRDALKSLGKNEEQIPVPVTGAFHLISSKLRAATCLVDISGIGLDYVKCDGRKLTIGGTATFQQIVTSKELNGALNSLLPKAARAYSTRIQRNTTTLQDVLFGYATYFDLLTALLALDTQVTVRGKQKRVVPLAQFFSHENRAVLSNSEIAVEFLARLPSGNVGASLQRVALTDGDSVAILNVVAVLKMAGKKCVEVRIAVGGGVPAPVRLTSLEQELTGNPFDTALVESASARAGDLIQPVTDVRGTAQYRRQISGVLVRRALEEAWQNAKGRTS